MIKSTIAWLKSTIVLPLHSKILKSNQTTAKMEIKKLKTASLADALKEMNVGQTCIAPDGYAPATVIKTCSELRDKGYLFQTSQRAGVQIITRLK